MPQNLIPYNNEEFGNLEILIENGKELFPASDMAKMLGYANPHKAISDHCRYLTKRRVPHPQNPAKKIEKNFIPESDVWRLITHSQLPSAQRIESWIFDEVLPAIRKTGSYTASDRQPETFDKKALPYVNRAISIITKLFEKTGCSMVGLTSMAASMYRQIGVPVPAIEAPTTSEWLTASEIAEKVGIMSTSGKPHGQAASAIIALLDVPDSMKQLMTYERNGHSGSVVKYKPDVADLVIDWLTDQQYPDPLQLNNKSFKVSFRR